MSTVWGWALPVGVGLAAWWLGGLVPVIGAPVLGIIFGLVIGQVAGQPAAWKAGTQFHAKRVLQASIVLLGAGMSLAQIAAIGGVGLPVMLGTIVVAVAAGHALTRVLKVDHETGLLVTYGTTICGASAIATMSQVIKARAAAIAVSIAVIVLYNVIAALGFPALGMAFGFTPETFGLWAGTAVNDTSSVVAAATSFDAQLIAAGAVVGGATASAYAVVVKLTRTLMLIPLAVFQQWLGARHLGAEERGATPWWRMVPAFLLWFLAAAALRTLGIIPEVADPWLKLAAHLGTTIAMTAVGMSSSLRAIREAGWRPLALGGILWVLIAVTALGLQAVTGQLVFVG
ncbi:MAG: putative sulfate exporter family transporter [Propionibacteriaceae bacterium]|nr:putative sulfate exporter family transporter [Propionibacteriaceae bacterium]